MKTLYFECNMGAAGDMLMAALLELHGNPDDFLKRLNNAGIPDVVVTAGKSVKCGITGTAVHVGIGGRVEDALESHVRHEHGHENHNHVHNHHEHNGYNDIEHLISHLTISDSVKKNASKVYKLIAEAESHVHGVQVSQIHFHEVGTMDAVADIVGVCMLMEELAPDKVLASPINVGRGHVRCAHGVLPVPAPATAHILQSAPIYSGQTEGELCTPTGAALLKHFVNDFCKMPVIRVDKLGYGMGKRDFCMANCVRAYIGNSDGIVEEVTELVCNLDDITPEALSFAQQLLLEEGALDVFTTPIGMKKGRQGFSFNCMCRSDMKDKMIALIFKHTTTLGVREYVSRRYVLNRGQTEIQTKFGAVEIKTSYGYGVNKSKPEYEDIARISRENKISISDVLKEIDRNRENSLYTNL